MMTFVWSKFAPSMPMKEIVHGSQGEFASQIGLKRLPYFGDDQDSSGGSLVDKRSQKRRFFILGHVFPATPSMLGRIFVRYAASTNEFNAQMRCPTNSISRSKRELSWESGRLARLEAAKMAALPGFVLK